MNDPLPHVDAWLGANSPTPELLALCEQVCAMSATEAELAQLDSILREDPKSREFYKSYVRLHGALYWSATHHCSPSENARPQARCEPISEKQVSPKTVLLPIGHRHNLGAGSASITQAFRIAMLLSLGLLAIGGVVRWRNALTSDVEKTEPLAVARLQSARDCVWQDMDHPPVAGNSLPSGQKLDIASGTAKLVFNSGTSVVVEGPASFELATATSLRLDRGTVAIRANGPVKEFTVDSREASIVDLGTSFGVHCDERGATEVEVFEGAVELYPQAGDDRSGRVLGLGSSARVHNDASGAGLDVTASREDRFGNLIELLWEDMPRHSPDKTDEGGSSIEARFRDAPTPGTVDTFYGATPGRGWLTPWVAAGNPHGEVISDNPLSGDGDPYLHLRFSRSYERVIAREYGVRPGFNPHQPHVISWKWRFEGNAEQFLNDFKDQVYFHGNPSFRRTSRNTNTWSIGVVGASEKNGKRRKVFGKHWFVYDGQDGKKGDSFERRNMIDTGMSLKAGVVYSFAIAVYPDIAKYDVAIRDDATTFIRSGLSFRTQSKEPGTVIHFGLRTNIANDPTSFSLDSIRIESLTEGGLAERMRTN